MFGRKRRHQEDDIDEDLDEGHVVDAALTTGPYDAADVPDDDEVPRVDLGSVRVPTLPGVQIGVAGDDRGNPKPELLLQTKNSMLRLVACAAPRSEGIWDEVREQLADGIKKQGGSVEEITDGDYGIELLARQPSGRQGMATVRLVGVDGPRWFLRGTFVGSRAGDTTKDTVLDETFRNVVVNRGDEAMPVREPLPLQLTQEMLDQQEKRKQAAQNTKNGGQADSAAGSTSPRRKPSPQSRDS